MYKNFTRFFYQPPGYTQKILRIMKLTTVLILIAILHVSAASYAQKITYAHKQATLQDILKEIRLQTGYNVLISTDNSKLVLPADVNFKDAPLTEVLEKTLKNLPLTYMITDKNVLIKEKDEPLLTKLKTALGVPTTVTAKIIDGTGQPMPGVNIMQKGTDNGTITNHKGVFTLTVPDDKTVITFSYIGFETQELRAKDISSGSVITLKPSLTSLNEVVINKGYYDEKRELSVGDVGVVTAKQIEQQPISNPLQALEGRVPGVQITQSTGLPGGAYTVQIRGQSSISSGTAPFYVIDGVPYDSQMPVTQIGLGALLNGALNGGSPLNYINPYDIESIEVLKDADATSIYGSRAANGAILITTKKGKAGQTKTDVSVQSGFNYPGRNIQLLNTQQYLQMRHEAFANDGATPSPADHDVNGDWDTTRSTNWEKVLNENTSRFTNAQMSISGGTTNTQFLVSGDYSLQSTGIPAPIPEGNDQSGGLHFNLTNTSENQKLHMTFSGSYISDKNTVQSADFALATALPPDAPPLYSPDGSLNWAPLIPGQLSTWSNPIASLYQYNKTLTNNLVANTVISYKLLDNLAVQASMGYTNREMDGVQTTPTTAYDPAAVTLYGYTGSSYFSTVNSHNWIFEPQVNYKLQIAKGILTTLVGGSLTEANNTTIILYGGNYLNDALLKDPQAAGQIYAYSGASEYKYEAIYGRLNYTWDDKYLLNLTARRDGSSRFGPGKQFGDFWSVGAGWIFTKEKYIADQLPWLSYGKLRGSYGTSGNDQIPDFQYLDIYNPTSNSYSGSAGLNSQNLFNTKLAWEIDRKLEGGIELGFLNNRINVQVSYYRNRSSNQLISSPVPTITGFSSIESNLPATVENSGGEYMLNTVNIKSKNFSWSSSFNMGYNRNKLLAYPDLQNSPYAKTFLIGQPITSFKRLHMLDVNPTTGLYQFEGANGQPTYSPDFNTDLISRINPVPQFSGGFENTLTYKGISLSFLFQFVKQQGINLFGATDNILPGRTSNIPISVLNNVWHKPGDIAQYQRLSQDFGSQAYTELSYAGYSDFAYGDASFIRLKNVSLSWTLPDNLLRKIHLQRCSLFIQAENLLTISGYNGIDPESQNTSTGPYRTITAGFRVTP